MINNFIMDADLKKYNTFRIGGKSKYLFLPETLLSFIEGLNYIKDNNLKYYILGNGSNVILPDEDFDGVIIVLKEMNDYHIENDILEVEAGMMLPLLNNVLLEKDYTNFSWAYALPGTIGGSIYGNAEAHKISIFDDLISINVLKDNEIITLKKEDIEYGYRYTNLKNEIILSARFNLVKGDVEKTREDIKSFHEYRMKCQPVGKASVGSTFRNPEGLYAGKLIEDINLKGKTIGGAKVSEVHANFVINDNNAKSSDIIELIKHIKENVKKEYDVDLILENKIVKWDEL